MLKTTPISTTLPTKHRQTSRCWLVVKNFQKSNLSVRILRCHLTNLTALNSWAQLHHSLPTIPVWQSLAKTPITVVFQIHQAQTVLDQMVHLILWSHTTRRRHGREALMEEIVDKMNGIHQTQTIKASNQKDPSTSEKSCSITVWPHIFLCPWPCPS